MIHLYTGDGKGKTTAAAGLALRMAGHGRSVLFAQFMKGSDTGELHALEHIPKIRICRSEKDFGFYRSMSGEQKEELTAVHNRLLEELLAASEDPACGLLVLDEITYPVKWKLLDEERLKRLLERGADVELVLTGRDPAPFLLDAADYITEMRALRHPYERGIPAREGVEY